MQSSAVDVKISNNSINDRATIRRNHVPLLKSKINPPSNHPFGRPSRIPVQRATKAHQQSNDQKKDDDEVPTLGKAKGRPPWNTHFKKSVGLLSRPPPAIPSLTKMVSTVAKPSRSQSSLIRNSLAKTEVGLDNMGHDCEDIYKKLTGIF